MSEEMAGKIVKKILADLTNRRGLRQEWDQIDASIRKEIIDCWERIVIETYRDGVAGK